jgi:hypothetical protein
VNILQVVAFRHGHCGLWPLPRIRGIRQLERDYDAGLFIRARSLITRAHRLTIYEGVAEGAFYDLARDPDELVNLWDAPAARDLRDEMMERLARKMMAMADASRWRPITGLKAQREASACLQVG